MDHNRVITLTFLFSIVCFIYAQKEQSLRYQHNIRVFECALQAPIYSFKSLINDKDYYPTPLLNVTYLDLRFDQTAKQYDVWLSNNANLKLEFVFEVSQIYNQTKLIVEVNVKVESCNKLNSSTNKSCAIVISILASLVLLLFASLAVALIVLKGRGLNFNLKMLRRCGQNEKNTFDNSISQFTIDSSLDINSNRISITEPEATKNSDSSSQEGSPIPPLRMPRKSSLKPPRTEAYPTPDEVEIDSDILPVVRRKSMVTFIDQPKVVET